jgi:hypothetical protein
MSTVTFVKTLKQSLIISSAALLLGAGPAMAADTAYDGQRAAQALLSPTIVAPANVQVSSERQTTRDDAQAQARQLLTGEHAKTAVPQRVAAAHADRAATGVDGGILARRMILRGGA